MNLRNKVLSLLLLAGFVLANLPCLAQHSPAIPKDTVNINAISIGPSLGKILERDAWFWGVSANYSYQFDGSWSLSSSLAFDRETDRKNNIESAVNTFTFIGTISYFVTPKISLTTGLGKGFLDDDNPYKRLSFTNGDWSTGISIGLSLPDFPYWIRDSYGISFAYEYNITQKEFSISVDLVIGLAF